jgi:hypothetical protein
MESHMEGHMAAMCTQFDATWLPCDRCHKILIRVESSANITCSDIIVTVTSRKGEKYIDNALENLKRLTSEIWSIKLSKYMLKLCTPHGLIFDKKMNEEIQKYFQI